MISLQLCGAPPHHMAPVSCASFFSRPLTFRTDSRVATPNSPAPQKESEAAVAIADTLQARGITQQGGEREDRERARSCWLAAGL